MAKKGAVPLFLIVVIVIRERKRQKGQKMEREDQKVLLAS
jgi:hypothetical protein